MADDGKLVLTTNDDPMAGFAATIGRRINDLERALFAPFDHISVSMAEAGQLLIDQAARIDRLRAHQVSAEELSREQEHLLRKLKAVPLHSASDFLDMIGKVQQVQQRNVAVIQRHSEEDGDAR